MEETAQLVGMLTDLIQAFAVVAAAWVGILGLNTWRMQLVGGKRIELAEESLILIQQSIRAIRSVRSPFARAGEGSTRQKSDNETIKETSTKNANFVPIERLSTHTQTFEQMQKLKVKCYVHFGPETEIHFNTILDAASRIAITAHHMIRTYGRPEPQSQQEAEKRWAQEEKRDHIIWDQGTLDEPDDFTKPLLQAASKLEAILKPQLFSDKQ